MINPISPTAATDFRGETGRVAAGQASGSGVDFEDVMHQTPSDDPDHIGSTQQSTADAPLSGETEGEDATSDVKFTDEDLKGSRAENPLGVDEKTVDHEADDRQLVYGQVGPNGPAEQRDRHSRQTNLIEQSAPPQTAAVAGPQDERPATGQRVNTASSGQSPSIADFTRLQPSLQSLGPAGQPFSSTRPSPAAMIGPRDVAASALPQTTGEERVVRTQVDTSRDLGSAPADRAPATLPMQQAPDVQHAQGMMSKPDHVLGDPKKFVGDTDLAKERSPHGFGSPAAHPVTTQTVQLFVPTQTPPTIGLAPQIPAFTSARDQHTGASYISLGDDLSQSVKSGDAPLAPTPSTNPSTVSQARPVLIQIVQFAPQPGQNAVEISLTPEELGKVRMSMVTTETTLVLTISAERSETLDLLRRHSAELGQEFSALGYDTIDFQFDGQGDRPANPEDTRPVGVDIATVDQRGDSTKALAAYVAGSGVDIRI